MAQNAAEMRPTSKENKAEVLIMAFKYTRLRKWLTALLALMLAIAPCALCEGQAVSEKLIGFTTEETIIYAQPTEFSSQIRVGRGFPVFVTGEVGQFYIVENAVGATGYALKRALSPTLPAGANPFTGGYDPGWDRTPCLILLPAGLDIYAHPYFFAPSMDLPAQTVCRILGINGGYYLVQNTNNGAMAYFHPSSLAIVAGLSR